MIRAAPARIAAALLAALLGGCAHLAVRQSDGLTFTERRDRLEAVQSWEMRGRLAVSTGKRGLLGSFTWRQHGDRLELRVNGPLGAGVLEVTGSPAKLTVTARGERRVLEDPEADLSRLLGWWMPVESLPEWLLGLSDPAFQADVRFDGGSTIASLEQRQWHVEYDAYQLEQGMLVPRRIDMSHDALQLKLTVDAWEPAKALQAEREPAKAPEAGREPAKALEAGRGRAKAPEAGRSALN